MVIFDSYVSLPEGRQLDPFLIFSQNKPIHHPEWSSSRSMQVLWALLHITMLEDLLCWGRRPPESDAGGGLLYVTSLLRDGEKDA